jgi:cytochrome b
MAGRSSTEGTEATVPVRVWDPLVRLFHWLLVASFAVAYLTQEQDYALHLQAGYVGLALLASRLPWGFVGPRHARFRDFVDRPAAAIAYVRDLPTPRRRRYLGHNPAGGWMIVLLLGTLLTIGVSGIALDGAENRAGPLGDTGLFRHTTLIIRIHTIATDVALALIGVHLAGVIASSLAHRENLVLAMITGRKRAQP